MDDEQAKVLQDWLETQKLYWQSLLQGEETESADWQALLDRCRGLAQQQLPPQNAELAEAMALQAKSFCRYGERLLRSMSGDQEAPDLEQTILDFTHHLQDQAGENFLRQWQLPEHLHHFFSQMGITLPSLPGYPFLEQGLQEKQHRFKHKLEQLEQQVREFRDAVGDYLEIQQAINQAATQNLLQSLKQGDGLTSLEQLYHLWVDHYEQSYLEQLQTQHYQATYGRLSNASLALKKLNQEYWEQEYRSLGLVPLKDYDQLLKRHHDLRKAFKQSRATQVDLQQQLDRTQQRLIQLETRLQQLESRAPGEDCSQEPHKP